MSAAWKHFIEFCCWESFKIYLNVPYKQQWQSQINLFTLLSLCNKIWKMFSGNSFNNERHLKTSGIWLVKNLEIHTEILLQNNKFYLFHANIHLH